MESLIANALLYAAGFDVWDGFASRLDGLFSEHPDDPELLDLEWTTDKKEAALHAVSLIKTIRLNTDRFGGALMTALGREYQKNVSDLQAFSRKAYDIWKNLPSDISAVEPFHILSYAGDPLSWDVEVQCRSLFQKAFCFYGK